MSARRQSPPIDERKASQLERLLRAMAPRFTPEWPARDEDDSAVALVKIFSFIAEGVIQRLNRAPFKNWVAFLDSLGIRQLPAVPSRVPVHFRVAPGTESEFLVPQRTQMSSEATEEREELPFETEEALWATPSALKQVVAIDPARDAIYQPPKGFLEQEQVVPEPPPYRIVTFSSQDSRSFQLDRVEDLEPKGGDLLRIEQPGASSGQASGICSQPGIQQDGKPGADHYIIESIEGELVSLETPLVRDYAPDTGVEKVTRFRLFESKNQQQHILYLGHPELFNVKSEALFTVVVSHIAGTQVGLDPLKVAWEYWGEQEDEEGQDWRPFLVADGSDGLSGDGRIELTKKEGEIKEREINLAQSRWIRCRLEEPIPSLPARQLPVLDQISFLVKSTGDGIPADQAFNNVTPLELPYHPFGTEPRTFDSFYVASQEAFSTKGSEITIDVELDLENILAEPAAVVFNGRIDVFARAVKGRLVEFTIDPIAGSPQQAVSVRHDALSDTTIARNSSPAVVVGEDNERIFVFVRAEDGHLYERFYDGDQWKWLDLLSPSSETEVAFNPSAVLEPNMGVRVFVTGSDGRLYSLLVHPTTGARIGIWTSHTQADDPLLDSSPFALSDVNDDFNLGIQVFATDQEGIVQRFAFDTQWFALITTDPGADAKARPFARFIDEERFRVWIRDQSGHLQEYDSADDAWTDFGAPGVEVLVASDPSGPSRVVAPDEDRRQVFVRGSDNRLWEAAGTADWISREGDSELRLSPSATAFLESDEGDILHVFSASTTNSILELRETFAGQDQPAIWLEYNDPEEGELRPQLSWEYWNGKGWLSLKVEDSTKNFLVNGEISFTLPRDLEPTEVSGQENFWIRARIIGGDYGRESFALSTTPVLLSRNLSAFQSEQQLISNKNAIRPPLVSSLLIGYESTTEELAQHCIPFNNLEYLDQSAANRTEGKRFLPFAALPETRRSIYLGFEKPFKGGPIRIFFAAKELPFSEESKPKVDWTFRAENDWQEVDFQDATQGLIKQEILELNVPEGFQVHSLFGGDLHWIKGSLIEGEYQQTPLLSGIFPNTAWSFQAETIRREILGSSDGEADQEFEFFAKPVLEGQEIRVREVLTEEEREALVAVQGEKAVFEVRDRQDRLQETWVLWSEVEEFFDSDEDSRHYKLDRANGKLFFGDGRRGAVPAAGADNIQAFVYQAGGGAQGNVKTGEITALADAVAGVESVLNPVEAGGGSDKATLDQMLDLGPAQISHRNRAVSCQDFEWLARQASRQVAKARCLSNTNNRLQRERGWVSLFIVPYSLQDKPQPSLELLRTVQRSLEEKSHIGLSAQQRIVAAPPQYVEVSVSVELYAVSIDQASKVEKEARAGLRKFFHPLNGGPEGAGWEFGRDVAASDVYALLEGIEGVDHAENLEFGFQGQSSPEGAQVAANALVANGKHSIQLKIAKEG